MIGEPCRSAVQSASPVKVSSMNWDQYLKMIVLVIVAVCVAFPVLGKPGVFTVFAVLYILGRLWLVGPDGDSPPVLRRRTGKKERHHGPQ